MDRLSALLGPSVADSDEESFLVFSHSIPSHSLGFLDSKASVLDISVAGRELSIQQSQGLLTSNRKEGTTGAVVWKVTPLFAEWIASPTNFLFEHGYLVPDSVVAELGTGVSGVVALTLASRIKRYIATDQDYVLRLLQQNISENCRQDAPSSSGTGAKRKRPADKSRKHQRAGPISSTIITAALDWEVDSVRSLSTLLDDAASGVDAVVACDCIYNEALIDPFVTCCADICALRKEEPDGNPTLCIVAQQLRSPDVFESWLRRFHRSFHVWRVPDELLIDPLKEGSGFVIHIGMLRPNHDP